VFEPCGLPDPPGLLLLRLADEELACVVVSKSVFQDANTVGLGRGLQFCEPLVIRDWLLPSEDREPPVQLVRGSDIAGGVDGLH